MKGGSTSDRPLFTLYNHAFQTGLFMVEYFHETRYKQLSDGL